METPKCEKPKPTNHNSHLDPNPFDENNNLIVDDPEQPEEHASTCFTPEDEDVLTAGNQSRQYGA